MEIVTKDTKFSKKNSVAIGSFDGLHNAHRSLIGLAKQCAMQEGLHSLVYTFTMPPSVYFDTAQMALFTIEEKEQAFAALGIDYLDIKPFTDTLAAMEPVDFVQYLVQALNAAHIVVGFNFRFGKKAAGTPALLEAYAKPYGVKVTIVEPICKEDEVISSSKIRELIAAADMQAAGQLLGRPYAVQGSVAHGKQLGRKLGFPTANLAPVKNKMLPPFGVYVTNVLVDNQIYKGVTNVGKRPTVDDGEGVTVETNLLDYDKELYGQEIKVLFLQQLRPEMKFSSVEELKEQIGLDKQSAKGYFAK